MFKHICVPVDNSDYSNRAIELAVELGRTCGAKLTGVHVYAAQLHDYRFKQMEYTLPDEYKDEHELERQRKIHDSLIAMGLQLISDSYLDVMARRAETAGLAFERKLIDGKHYKVLIEDCLASDYDLVVMGALGMSAVKDSQLGSVTERFVRKVPKDTLVVRNADRLSDSQGAIVVGLDGSPQSFNGLRLGIGLAKALGRVGVRSHEHEVDLGSNTENLPRLLPCNVLLTGGKFYPPLDVLAEEIISWTEEAEARLERVPPQVKGVARTALLRYAIEQGHTVITNKVIDEAMAIFMPTRMAEKMQIMAEDLAVAKLRADNQVATAICSICGYTVKGPNPVVACPVCKASAEKFQIISRNGGE